MTKGNKAVHNIRINKDTELTIKLPRYLSKGDVRDLMDKIDKLDDLPKVKVVGATNTEAQKGYWKKDSKYDKKQKGPHQKYDWKKIYEEYTSFPRVLTSQELAEKYGISKAILYNGVANYKRKIGIKKPKARRKTKFSAAFVTEVIQQLKQGKSTKEISRNMGMKDSKQVVDLIRNRTGKRLADVLNDKQ